MEKLPVKALGQTVKHEGGGLLVTKKMPADCMVLFVSLETWEKIKDNVIVEE